MGFLPLVLIFVIMYFLIIMPARKKQKQHQNLVNTLKVGDKVITGGGIYGTVSRTMEDRIELEVDKNTRLQVTRQSVQVVVNPQGDSTKQ
ncbi:MAG: preprotein translocase subunit YajC [bacterium]|nr:preprotein translocase subunit YajC [bacterium]